VKLSAAPQFRLFEQLQQPGEQRIGAGFHIVECVADPVEPLGYEAEVRSAAVCELWRPYSARTVIGSLHYPTIATEPAVVDHAPRGKVRGGPVPAAQPRRGSANLQRCHPAAV
jgi:hypothetical protein